MSGFLVVWPEWLHEILKDLLQQSPKALENLLKLWDTLSRLRDRIRYHGTYEILDYDSTLQLVDPKGEKAILTRRQAVRFLQDDVVAVHDYAWGDGRLFARYRCQPGVPVDFYEDGARHHVLISLRETKHRGETLELWIERVIKGGFVGKEGWLETEIDHWVRHLRISIVFPKKRPCRRATLSQRSTGKTTLLSQKHFALLPDGRQKLTWETHHPKFQDRHTIKWVW